MVEGREEEKGLWERGREGKGGRSGRGGRNEERERK